MDESGDLGFGKNSSRFFVVAGVLCSDNQYALRRFAKAVRRKLRKRKKDFPEIKANKLLPHVAEFALAQLPDVILGAIAIYADKTKTYAYVRDSKSQRKRHYNYFVRQVIQNIAMDINEPNASILIQIDRYHAKRVDVSELESYIHRIIGPYVHATVKTVDSTGSIPVQIADIVAYSAHKYIRAKNGIDYGDKAVRISKAINRLLNKEVLKLIRIY